MATEHTESTESGMLLEEDLSAVAREIGAGLEVRRVFGDIG